MLVTQWLDHDNRETRDIDFLGFGPDTSDAIKEIDDGLVFAIDALTAGTIREKMEYGGIRLRTSRLSRTNRIPARLAYGLGAVHGLPNIRVDV